MTIHEFFEHVLDQPGIYIGFRSVSRLKAFMDGYTTARAEIGLLDDDLNAGFSEWVSERFRITSAHNWASIILFMSGNDENQAFEMVKDLWKQYATGLESKETAD